MSPSIALPFPSGAASHANAASSLAADAHGLTYGLAVVDRALRPVALAVDAVRLGSAFSQDGDRIGPRTTHAAGGIAGGWLGAYIGGSSGSQAGEILGAGIGALGGGPVGAVVGATLGGMLGSLGGAIGGGLMGAKLGERLVDHPPNDTPSGGIIS